MACLVLDAMGVIFEAADDVGELLIPFIQEKGGSTDEALLQSAYLDASLGRISADDFWERVGLGAHLEDDFLLRHRLNAGVVDTMKKAQDARVPVWCLSNDVGRWSQKLRQNLAVDSFLQGSVISGDAGLRKPDPEIYQALLVSSGYRAEELLFVDDRDKNVATAQLLGIESVLLESTADFESVIDWIDRQ